MGRVPKWPMSAYSASAPVMASTTAPMAMNAMKGRSAANLSACTGETAVRISGLDTTWGMPMTAMVTNHATMIGPKNLPTAAVPKCCTANSRQAPPGTTAGRVLEPGVDHVQPLEGRHHGDGGRDDRVPVEEGGTQHPHREDPAAHRAAFPSRCRRSATRRGSRPRRRCRPA